MTVVANVTLQDFFWQMWLLSNLRTLYLHRINSRGNEGNCNEAAKAEKFEAAICGKFSQISLVMG